jgi:hypothetical protein
MFSLSEPGSHSACNTWHGALIRHGTEGIIPTLAYNLKGYGMRRYNAIRMALDPWCSWFLLTVYLSVSSLSRTRWETEVYKRTIGYMALVLAVNMFCAEVIQLRHGGLIRLKKMIFPELCTPSTSCIFHLYLETFILKSKNITERPANKETTKNSFEQTHGIDEKILSAALGSSDLPHP